MRFSWDPQKNEEQLSAIRSTLTREFPQYPLEVNLFLKDNHFLLRIYIIQEQNLVSIYSLLCSSGQYRTIDALVSSVKRVLQNRGLTPPLPHQQEG